MKRFRILMIITLMLLCAFLTSCLEVKQAININKDGSGDARLEIAVQKEWAPQVVPKLKGDMPKGWNIVEEKEKDGKHVIVFGRKFKDVSELNDSETKYVLSSERKGFLKKSYSLEVKQLKSSDMPFPYEVMIELPGGIDETNGTKISSGKVKWNLQGFRRGTELSVKSSAFAMPDFASLKKSFNNIFDSLFYKEAIVFLRDKNIFVMDSDGKNQRQLTKEGVGSWSVSRDGKIIFDRFRRFDEDKRLTDLNIYIASVTDGEIKNLSGDNKSITPVISPDGDKIAFVKVDEKFSEAQQKIIPRHTTPFYIKEGTPKKTGIYIIDLKLEQQKRVVGELRSQLLPKEAIEYMGNITEWTDDSLFWSQDASRLHFTRGFRPYYYGEGPDFSYSYLLNLSDGDIEYVGEIGGEILNWIGKKIIYGRRAFSSIYDVESRKRQDLLDTHEAILSPDGNTLVYIQFSSGSYTLYAKNMSSIENSVQLLQSTFPESIGEPTWNHDGTQIAFVKGTKGDILNLWIINHDGTKSKMLADNASSPKWTLIPRITFISPSLVKIIILVTIALTGILLLFGMALIARKAVKAVIPKKRITPRSIFCTQCGKENSPDASFCVNCGQRLK